MQLENCSGPSYFVTALEGSQLVDEKVTDEKESGRMQKKGIFGASQQTIWSFLHCQSSNVFRCFKN